MGYAYNNINLIGIVVFEMSEFELLEFELSEFDLLYLNCPNSNSHVTKCLVLGLNSQKTLSVMLLSS